MKITILYLENSPPRLYMVSSGDPRALKFLDAGLIGEAFLHHEKRKVDKGACISFRGKNMRQKLLLLVSR